MCRKGGGESRAIHVICISGARNVGGAPRNVRDSRFRREPYRKRKRAFTYLHFAHSRGEADKRRRREGEGESGATQRGSMAERAERTKRERERCTVAEKKKMNKIKNKKSSKKKKKKIEEKKRKRHRKWEKAGRHLPLGAAHAIGFGITL